MAGPVVGTAVIAGFHVNGIDRGALARPRQHFDGNAMKRLMKPGLL
jgi:hypothetical protein